MMSVLSLLDSTTLLVGGVTLLLTWLWWASTRRLPGMPPGPGLALPVVGHLLRLDQTNALLTFRKWRLEYGDVFSLYMGSNPTVVLNGFPVIKEALVKMADVFSHKPHDFFERLTEGCGIVGASGPVWKEQRKTAIEILRQLGMGKNVLAERVQEEIGHFLLAVEDLQGAPVDPMTLITASVSNNICSIIFGQRFQYDDPTFLDYLTRSEETVRSFGLGAINFFPFLEHLPGDPFKAKLVLNNFAQVEDTLIKPRMESHRKTLGEEPAQDFIHAYQTRIQQRGNSDNSINDKNLLKSVGDLFIAGTETTSTTISWTLIYFLHFPEVQDKCFKEISDVIGTERLPSMRDKPEMAYMEATIMEIIRKVRIVPVIPHSTPQDVLFRGHVIPKGAFVLINFDSVLHDPLVWGDPENFRPERFIGPDGKLTKPEEFIPFSVGRRVCVGESLARVELFLYIVSLVQRFRFLPVEGEPLPSLEGALGGTIVPKPFKIRAVRRK